MLRCHKDEMKLSIIHNLPKADPIQKLYHHDKVALYTEVQRYNK